jgi:hypothetical protein
MKSSFARIGKAAAITALAAGVSLVAHPVARAGGSGAHPGQQGTPSQQGQQPSPSQQPGGAAQQGAQTPAVVAGQIITAAMTVEKIDKAKGTVTLKDAQGKKFDAKAGPNVDLNNLHTGDRVTATYSQEIAVSINKASRGAPTMTQTTVVRGGVAEQQATVTARIVSVDPKSNSVVIRAPDGSTHTLKVSDPALQPRLAQIKPGDAFDVSYTQAVALTVEPRK